MPENYNIKEWDFNKRHGKTRLQMFAEAFKSYQERIDFKVSARGWCYLMEQAGFITKDKFDLVNELLNRARKQGLLPVDFCAEDIGRQFYEIHEPDFRDPSDFVHSYFKWLDYCEEWYEPDWWGKMTSVDGEVIEAEEYYIQMVVEKVDLLTLFRPVCKSLHIPIANAKGWQSIRQRAEYARRFQKAREKGMQCVLLYCGDHDPDGLRISDTLRKNLDDVKDVVWENGDIGYDPFDLNIHRFGLNYEFIIENNLTWIDNLITGSGMNLANTKHPNNSLDYVQDYIQTIGVRKCEANAIVVNPTAARNLCRDAAFEWIGDEAPERFKARKNIMKQRALRTKDKLKLYNLDKDNNVYPLKGWDQISEELKNQL